MKKLFIATMCAMMASAALAQKPAANLPNDAPKGKRWMACYLEFASGTKKYGPDETMVAGYWLVNVPEDKRKETEEALKEKFLAEYLPVAPSEKPVGQFKRALCTSFKSRGEWAGFVQWVKERRHFRTDFQPSFSQGFVSSREHIDRE